MSTIVIGQYVGDEERRGKVKVDLPSLVDSRCLIQANSGGGKSYLLRLIAERAAGKLQTIIIDPEGEFSTLREKLDLLIVGSEGEIKPAPHAAPLLARRLAELNVSAVIDLYGVPLHDRRLFVKGFCESLIELPKSIYHPMLVAIDECHRYAPEKSEGDSIATAAVIGLADSGRKRGIGLVALTQRLSKLHKDAAAELNNVFVGRTWLPNDQERCGKILGMNASERVTLRDLRQGEFYAFGPAIVGANGVVRMKVDEVETTHPKAGERHRMKPPAASKVIVGIAAELADLPQQAEAQIKDLAAARARITQLERELRVASRGQRHADPPVADREQRERLKRQTAIVAALRKGIVDAMKVIAKITSTGFEAAGVDAEQIERAVKTAVAQVVKMVNQKLQHRQAELERLKNEARKALASLQKLVESDEVDVAVDVRRHNPPFEITSPKPRPSSGTSSSASSNGDIPRGERATLIAAAQHETGVSREQLTQLTGYKRSSRDAYVSRLKEKGYMADQGDLLVATTEGVAALGDDYQPLPTGDALRAHWHQRLPQGEREVLNVVCAEYPNAVARDQIGERTNYQRSSRDAYLSRLAARKLVIPEGRGMVKASPMLFD